MDKENKDIPMPEIAKREENFINGAMPSTVKEKKYYMQLQRIANGLEDDMDSMQCTKSKESILSVIFFRVYDFVMAYNNNIFDSIDGLFFDVKDVCFFISLCEYLHDTKHIKGSSLRKFIYDYSPMGYGLEGSQNYFDYNRPKHFAESSSDKPEKTDTLISSDEAALRQYRKRLLSKRPVYNYATEWSAMRKTSEHEWKLYFALDEADPAIRDTAKRMRLLYDGINTALNAPMDEEYVTRLETAYKKFQSKLEKIQYERFLDLGKFSLEHINKDATYYGIDLYRFEKQFRLYGITNGVNRLLECQSESKRNDILSTELALNSIPFPKLRQHFGDLKSIKDTLYYADRFYPFLNEMVRSSRLIIDEFVEEGVFGEDWENLFLKLTNEMVEDILYDPTQINYSISDESQEMFSLYLEAPVYANVNQGVQYFKYVKPPLFSNTEDTEDSEDVKDAGDSGS